MTRILQLFFATSEKYYANAGLFGSHVNQGPPLFPEDKFTIRFQGVDLTVCMFDLKRLKDERWAAGQIAGWAITNHSCEIGLNSYEANEIVFVIHIVPVFHSVAEPIYKALVDGNIPDQKVFVIFPIMLHTESHDKADGLYVHRGRMMLVSTTFLKDYKPDEIEAKAIEVEVVS